MYYQYYNNFNHYLFDTPKIVNLSSLYNIKYLYYVSILQLLNS